MGSCVSSHKDTTQDSSMKLKLSSFDLKKDNSKIVMDIPPSPVKEKTKPTIADLALKSNWSPPRSVSSFTDSGSKEETFFDSQPWLESDCEDDFFSVNGDFTPSRTPSRGSTPLHPSFIKGSPRVNKCITDTSCSPTPEPASVEKKKKKLVDLFRDSIREQDAENQNALEEQNMPIDKYATPTPRSSHSTYVSGNNSASSSERSVNGEFLSERKRTNKSVQCCLPIRGFVSCRSMSERSKMNSAVSAGNNTVAV